VALLLCMFVAGGVAADAQRVVSTDASITAIVAALGASERLVAVDVTSVEAARELPRIGYHRALAAEGLLALMPDLLLASEHAGPPETLQALRAAGVDVVTVPAAQTLDAVRDNVRRIAGALGAGEQARVLLDDLDRRAATLAARRLDAPPMLLLREGEGGLRVAGEGTTGAALIALLGGDNAVAYDGYRSYSQEALLVTDPAWLLIAAREPVSAEEFLARYPLLRHGRAAARGQVRVVAAGALIGGLGIATLDEAARLLESRS
jgi:iron complex transport system substrate-binding protein